MDGLSVSQDESILVSEGPMLYCEHAIEIAVLADVPCPQYVGLLIERKTQCDEDDCRSNLREIEPAASLIGLLARPQHDQHHSQTENSQERIILKAVHGLRHGRDRDDPAEYMRHKHEAEQDQNSHDGRLGTI